MYTCYLVKRKIISIIFNNDVIPLSQIRQKISRVEKQFDRINDNVKSIHEQKRAVLLLYSCTCLNISMFYNCVTQLSLNNVDHPPKRHTRATEVVPYTYATMMLWIEIGCFSNSLYSKLKNHYSFRFCCIYYIRSS